MPEPHFFGKYNSIYFLMSGTGITDICDRRSRKRSVPFCESELVDLSGTQRQVAKMSTESELPASGSGPVTLQGRTYARVGRPLMRMPAGFGRTLRYEEVEGDPACLSVLLTITLPPQVGYRIAWTAVASREATFELAEGIEITVLTRLPWTYANGTLTTITPHEEGELSFLIRSLPQRTGIRDVAIVCASGTEAQALLARAACGPGFVPCFVIDPDDARSLERVTETLASLQPATTIVLGDVPHFDISSARVVRFSDELTDSNQVATALGGTPLASSLETASRPELAGPALFAAMSHNAALRFRSGAESDLVLAEADGRTTRLPYNDFIGVELDFGNTARSAELTICESTWSDLLVCQAIGYAQLRGTKIAFINPVASRFAAGYSPTSFLEGVSLCREAVPAALRTPEAETLTIFTLGTPLHLTPIGAPDSAYWFNSRAVAHLPGQLASVVVPRALLKHIGMRPAVSLGVIFDAFTGARESEVATYMQALQSGMNHPIYLAKSGATKRVLGEILEMFASDLVLLICHGNDDYIEDSLNERITADEVARWKLRNTPIVFNNSCSSWRTTGRAFLAAGAAGYIGTLWPVSNNRAADVAAEIGNRIRASEAPDIAIILSAAERDVGAAKPAAESGAYIYVGLPGMAFLNDLPINAAESLHVTSELVKSAYETLTRIVMDRGRPNVAASIHSALVPVLRRRVQSFLVPGELPLPFPPFPGTVLDAEYFLSLCDYEFGATLLTQLAHEHQRPVIGRMDEFLQGALKELVEWDERHDGHMGRSPEYHAAESQRFGVPIGHDGGDLGFYRRSASYVLSYTLPFSTILCENRDFERAQFWFDLSGKLATLREDLSPDGSVSDDALLARIRKGVPIQHRVFGGKISGRETVEIDILANAVSKSELANRFGIVLKRLNRGERAVPFFEAARDLASPGSEEFANATSNLASVMSGTREQRNLYAEALERQIASKDFRNAIITTANILRGVDSQPSDAEFLLNRALAWLPLLDTDIARTHARSDLWGAASVFFAAQKLTDKVASAIAQIVDLVSNQPLEKGVAVHLNEVLDYYVRKGLFASAAIQALANGQVLEQAGLPDVALKTFSIAADSAVRAANGRSKRYFRLFFDCSKRIAQLVAKQPESDANQLPVVTLTRENTQSLWQQFADRGDRRMAIQAYGAVKVWQPGASAPEWEDLGHALHPKNLEAVSALSRGGALRREAVVEIESERGTRVRVTTLRADSQAQNPTARAVPDQVFIYWPLHRESSVTLPPDAKTVANAAVFRLGRGDRVVVSETTAEGMRTDDQGTYVYEDVWGSTTIPYSLTLVCRRGLVPTHFEFRMLEGVPPEANVTSVAGKLSIVFRPTEVDRQRWLGTLVAVTRDNVKLQSAIEDVWSCLGEPVPFDLYKATIRLLAPSTVSGLKIVPPSTYPVMGAIERRALECVLKRIADPSPFAQKDSCREVLLQIVIVVHEDLLLWPDRDYELRLNTVAAEPYRNRVTECSHLVRLFGQALFVNTEFKSAVVEEADLVDLFVHAASRLTHEVLPAKNLSMRAMVEAMLPFARSVMLMKASTEP